MVTKHGSANSFFSAKIIILDDQKRLKVETGGPWLYPLITIMTATYRSVMAPKFPELRQISTELVKVAAQKYVSAGQLHANTCSNFTGKNTEKLLSY